MSQPQSRTIFNIVILVLALGVAITAVFGWIVRGNVLESANRTDLEMRAVAWAAITFACTHEGRFPINLPELLSMQPLPESIDCTPGPEANWPLTLADALRGEPAPSLAESCDRLDVAFSSDGSLPPLIGNNGLPTLIDPPTMETIREWLNTFALNEESGADP